MNNLRNAQTVLLIDADDTLWHDSKHFRTVEVAFADLALHLGYPRVEALGVLKQALEKTRSKGEKRFIEALYSASKVLRFDTRLACRLNTLIDNFKQRRIQLLPGVKKALSDLKIPKILLTKGRSSEQLRKLRFSGIGNQFVRVIVVPRKNPASFHKILRKMGIEGTQVISIGNSVIHDILPATQNSASAIWLDHPENIQGRNAKVPPGVSVVKAWREIPSLVRSIDRKHYSQPTVLLPRKKNKTTRAF